MFNKDEIKMNPQGDNKGCPHFGDHSICPVPMDKCPCPGRSLRVDLVRVHEMEAKRWAMELHDGLIPLISSVKMQVEYLGELLPQRLSRSRDQVAVIKENLDDLYSEVHSLCSNLRPAIHVDFDLLIMMRSYIERFCREGRLAYTLDLPASIEGPFDPVLEVVLFRTLQECLNNVKKHSHASKIAVKLMTDPERCVLRVEDDGRGFDTGSIIGSELLASGRIGLLNMQERAQMLGGQLTVTSQPNCSTVVELKLPWLGRHGSDLACL
jgi:Signal transduction histidine kinase